MSVNPIVAKHLSQARAELVAQRDALDHDIAQIDSMLSGYAATPPARRSAPRGASPSGPSMRQVILEVFELVHEEMTTGQVVDVLSGKSDWEPSSIRSQLARMVKGGELVSPNRGVYRLSDPTDTSGSAEAEPEAGVTTDEEGENQLETPSHDPDHATTGWNRDRGDHPVVEAG